MISLEEIRGAVARGYCSKENENKVLDPDLCEAISAEIKKLVDVEFKLDAETDIIGGFPIRSPNCLGCGKTLQIENALLTDGCPCNTNLGVNSMNETRWRLLMEWTRQQSLELDRLQMDVKYVG